MMKRSEWMPVATDPKEKGWYEYRGWLIEGMADGEGSEVVDMYWNGWQWGYWMDNKHRKGWVQLAEMVTDQWRGLVPNGIELRGEPRSGESSD